MPLKRFNQARNELMEQKRNSHRSLNLNRRSHRSFNGSQRHHTQWEKPLKQEKAGKWVIRAGVSIFINHVSKWIKTSTLKEAFQEYGNVLDVYIAYYNRRRWRMNSTFAFVRYSNLWEAMNAVDLANNRRMVGFTIKVFLDRKTSETPKSIITNGKCQIVANPNRAKIARVKDSRTYKEALLNKTRICSKEVNNGSKEGTSEACGRGLIIGGENLAPKSIVINEADKEWLKNCLIGQVSAMYDQDFVQQILQSEGFRVKVSRWIGFYSIICFEEEEQIEIFWDLRETMLKHWFSDIDTVGNFMKSKKLRVWVCIEGIPLEACNESVLVSIGSQWGEVIRLDPDTAERNRLDIAKILIGVNCLSAIPPLALIEVNGVVHKLRIAKAEYDDDRCWIDSKQLNSQVEIHSNSYYNKSDDPYEGDHIEEDFKVMENDASLKPL
ncbi:hypothetical protein GQ457_18G003410 [Hibiscus cannabinus]